MCVKSESSLLKSSSATSIEKEDEKNDDFNSVVFQFDDHIKSVIILLFTVKIALRNPTD